MNAGASASRFEVSKFTPDGGCSGASWVLLQGGAAVAGMILGFVAGGIAQFFYLVLIFPILIGLLVGVAGTWLIQKGKVRSPWLALVAALVGGLSAVWAMHYTEYYMFLRNQAANISPEDLAEMKKIAANLEKIKKEPIDDPNVQQFVDYLNSNPDAVRALNVNGLMDFVDLAAHQGVTISKAGQKGNNLGYTGSYIYWLLELLVLAGMAVAVMRSAAREPFCSACDQWKTWRQLGWMHSASKSAIETGNLDQLPSHLPVGSQCAVLAYLCPNCGCEGTADIKLEEHSLNEKNELVKKELALVTYPGEAVPHLTAKLAAAAQATEEQQIADAMKQSDAKPEDFNFGPK